MNRDEMAAWLIHMFNLSAGPVYRFGFDGTQREVYYPDVAPEEYLEIAAELLTPCVSLGGHHGY